MVAIVIAGASGKMGRALIEATLENIDAELVGGTVRSGSSLIGADAGELVGKKKVDAPIRDSLEAFSSQGPVVIDFSTIDSTMDHLSWCVSRGAPCVIGTTGFSVNQEQSISEAAKKIPVIYAPNFSVGVNVVFDLLARAARLFGDTVDIEVIETHHRQKLDAPSGTALALGRIIANALDRDLDTTAVYGREGQTGIRPRDQIGFATVRGGDVVGDHTVLFAADGERVEITHKASNRKTFASGAVRSAVWASQQEPGLYSMRDVLGI
ncbi:MAG TPA: 4-hydroxy-tetrahydrodipicolinate reductase [Gammaproteobacteria bacterium]|nr:4-hydroxy-tetrahydrodipicolinate reductase [Gammaproteobacteria bacterium]HBX26876.1 4-hydroxy-tetrahydrodipicolinate reductase [Gammaproteobacteria bacterium]|tara:strand:+ start:183 stop:983 length:801 start_codon:yes stop_codon:yes gene_type:complete